MQKILISIAVFLWICFCIPAYTSADSDISKDTFTINVKTFTPGSAELAWGWGSSAAVNGVLRKMIDSLIIAFWVLSLLFMTIGAGYMIIYHWQDDLLSRWKSIFIAGLTSLAIALSAGMIVKFIAYLLYQ